MAKGTAGGSGDGEDEDGRETHRRRKRPSEEKEQRPDARLVEEAARFIREALRRTVERGFLDVGGYLFKNFFRGDPALVRSRSPVKGESFAALLGRCDSAELPLGRSALYSAVGVAAMHEALGNGETAFRQLPRSHQIALLPLHDPQKVERLAAKALAKRMAVRALKREVAEERAASAPKGNRRGRKPAPMLLKSLKAATVAFTVDGRFRSVTRAHVDVLNADQKAEVLRMVDQLAAMCEGVKAKLNQP